MKRSGSSWWLLALLAALFALPAFAASEDEAGDVSEVDKDSSGPLRERIRPVSGHLFLMKGRFEVSPGVGISFRDAFFSKYIFGAAFTYHFNEDWAASLRGGYALNVISGSAQICTPVNADGTGGGCNPPTEAQLLTEKGQPTNKVFGRTTLLASLDLQWSPLYGKMSLSAERFLHFNMYAVGGPAIVMYGPDGAGQLAIGGNLGAGFRFFVNRFVTVRLELRDTIYMENGFYAINGSTSSLRNQLLGEVGVSFFFPMQFEEGR